MHFSGRKEMRINHHSLAALFSIIYSTSILAEGYGSHVPMSGEDEELSVHGQDREAIKAHLPDTLPAPPQMEEVEPDSFYYLAPASGTEEQISENWREKILSVKGQVPFKYENEPKLMRNKESDIFREVYNKGGNAFTFTYIRDEYTIADSRDVFEKTFREPPNRVKMGTFHLGVDNYLSRGSFRLAYGGNFGVGMYSGYGKFVGGGKAQKTRFTLWTIPIDFLISLECTLGKLANLQIAGGPSIMGLYQSRTDREDGDWGKRRRQVGFGYTGIGRFKISLANILPRSAFEMFREYDVTNYYLNLEARLQEYQKFQDEIKVTGTSFGIGLSFDFL